MKHILYTLSVGLLLCLVTSTGFAQTQVATLAKTSVEADSDKDKNTKKEKKTTTEATDTETTESGAAQETTNSGCESCRWFEPTAASFSMRYRTTTDANNLRTLNQGQQRIILAGKFKFDKEGKYSINIHASSGYYFNWAYADTGLGNTVSDTIRQAAPGMSTIVARELAPPVIQSTVQSYIAQNYPNATPEQIAQLTPVLTAQFTPLVTAQVRQGLINQLSNTQTRSKGWNLFVRQLYFQAKPVKGLELSYGSMPISKGVNSEATSYDNDGYVMGGRVSFKRPEQVWFDEMSVTYGFLGDIFQPNLFRRLDRAKQSNYHQFLVRKKFLGGKIDVSTDYTFQDGTDTMREAVLFNVKNTKVLDSIRVEAYQRIGDKVVQGKTYKAASGFYVAAEKTLFDRLTLHGGLANIDRHYTVYGATDTPTLDWFGFAINGDQTGLGKRGVFKADYKLTKDLSISTLYSQTFANKTDEMRYYWNKTHFNIAVTYDILEGAKRLGWFK